jgi:GNAT superfamily N-acetyltransferase
MRKDDKSELLRVCQIWLNESIRCHNFVSDHPAQFWRSRQLDFLLDVIFADGYVWKENGLIKGFMTISGNYIRELFVDSLWHGKGIGTALMNRAKQYAKEKKYDYLETSVYEKNQSAIYFYINKCGFEQKDPYAEPGTGLIKFKMEWQNHQL